MRLSTVCSALGLDRLLTGFGLLAALAVATPAHALQGEGGGEEGGEEEVAEVTDSESEDDEWLAVVGGDIHVGTGEVLRGATLLARKGVIRRIGYDLFIPESAKVLDAKGLFVYPGLVAINSSGLLGGSGDLRDSVDPFSRGMILGLAAGITTTAQSAQACKLKRGQIEGVVINEKFLSNVSYNLNNPNAKRGVDEKLAAAAKYLRQYREWEEKVKEDKELKEPSKRGLDSQMVSILRGEVLARFRADERADLLNIARLAQRYGFRPVIDGCREGWTVAGELGRAGAYAIVHPRERADKSEELLRDGGSSIENAAILHAHGVQVCVTPGMSGLDTGGEAGRDIMHLTIEAGFAVRGGLPERAALEAITITPARLMGVDHRVGSLEVGKDCDLILTDGDVLHYQTFVQLALIEGKVVYEKDKELFFAHIRPHPGAIVAPEERTDRGEDATPEEATEEVVEEEPEAEDA